jgi:Rad3-related DNA helicase
VPRESKPETARQSAGETSAAATPAAGKARDGVKPFVVALYDFTRTLEQARRDLCAGAARRHQAHHEKLQEAHRTAQQQHSAALGELDGALREAGAGENPPQKAAEAERSFHSQRQKADLEASSALEAAARELREGMREDQEKEQRNAKAAFHVYVRAVSRGWAEIDAESLDPRTLAEICQSISSGLALLQGWPGPLPC